MCLAIPGEIISIDTDDGVMRTGRVSFAGVVKDINLSYTPDAGIGDYVLVHVGFAISRINEEEAGQVFRYLQQLEDVETGVPRTGIQE